MTRLNLVAFAKLVSDNPLAPWQARVLEYILRHPRAPIRLLEPTRERPRIAGRTASSIIIDDPLNLETRP